MTVPVVAIVVNWNRGKDTLRCVASLLDSDLGGLRVVLVDNGSRDDWGHRIRETFPQIDLITLPRNMGFTGGYNAGIRRAMELRAERLFLVNNDAIVDRTAISALVAAADLNPGAGLFGPKIFAIGRGTRLVSAGGWLRDGWNPVHRGMGQEDAGRYDRIEDVQFLSGCALLIPAPALRAIGPLDERLFAYFEDVDWCLRARDAGYGVLYVPAAAVRHPDTSIRDETSAAVTYFIARNAHLLVRKHRLSTSVRTRLWLGQFRTLSSWSLRRKWSHRRDQRNALAVALLDAALGRYGPMSAQARRICRA